MADFTVSCIIPTHGRPDFLREALDSVLSQTLLPDEILVVSDDGNEESAAVVASFSGAAIPVSYIRNEERPGASGSRNVGAAQATGEWLAFLDDDDLWLPGYLLHSRERIEESGKECVVTWLEMFRDGLRAPGLEIRPNVPASDAASRNPGITGSNFVIHRDAFAAIGGFDGNFRVMNDLDFFYRYLLAGRSYEVNARPEVLQRKHSSGQLTRATEMRAAGIDKYILKHRGTMRARDVRQLKLAAHRTRYHAADSAGGKIKHLLLGAANASPSNVVESLANWKKRKLWREK
ncbi:glycosyl transferase [Microbacterium barkeri]|uniref:Glycosyl transferase n=1 Tax=Microbacterium barkeri TaxID=33917 RepID=A0A9W6H166_9MICO|nr:glycosyltransferase family A protein [Microbacterium barkeri]MDI6942721.1 glycosyltransferase family A protein [Microbacterium barkeri]MDR6875119.1 glycosyltransferase involved in cell wall biosynthesis [Microbacterium barkeri]GLJ60721.1 glycosyl transferase [Microbacterium barkeri]